MGTKWGKNISNPAIELDDQNYVTGEKGEPVLMTTFFSSVTSTFLATIKEKQKKDCLGGGGPMQPFTLVGHRPVSVFT